MLFINISIDADLVFLSVFVATLETNPACQEMLRQIRGAAMLRADNELAGMPTRGVGKTLSIALPSKGLPFRARHCHTEQRIVIPSAARNLLFAGATEP
jgi:hypothetical protein